MTTLTNEARIILEAAALALEINYPDIEAIREMLKGLTPCLGNN